MEKRFDKVDEKLENLSKDMSDVKVILATQEENLRHHMYRTELAEENINLLRNEMRQELTPVKEHVALINNILKLAIAAGGLLIFLDQLGILKRIINYLF